MKVVFIGGKLRGETPWHYEQNVRLAEDLSAKLWNMGAAVICAHTMARFLYGAAPDDAFTDGLNELIRRSDALVLLPNWITSTGTVEEKEMATKIGKRIFYVQPPVAGADGLLELKEWLLT